MGAEEQERAGVSTMQRPSRRSLYSRYKWSDLTEPEQNAIRDALGIVSVRAAVGLGLVSTVAAGIASARQGKPPLPPALRYGSFGFFAFAGMYAGFLSAGPLCARRILAVPNSRVADDLRSVVGDWQAREKSSEVVTVSLQPAGKSEKP